MELREEYEKYNNLQTIIEERSEEHEEHEDLEERLINEDDVSEMPSKEIFHPNQTLKPEKSSELNQAVIYSSEHFSEPKISNFFKQESLSKENEILHTSLRGEL